jgi:hypothetical protein
MVNTRIEGSLNDLLVSLSHDLGINRTELVKACLRFALSSTAFRKRMDLVLTEGDLLTLQCLGDVSITIRTLVRRLSRRADVIMEHPSAAWLSVVRLNHSGLTGHGAPFRRLQGTMGQEEKEMNNRIIPRTASNAQHTPEIRPDLEEG